MLLTKIMIIELPVNNNVDDINEKQGEVYDLTKSTSRYQLMKIQIQEL